MNSNNAPETVSPVSLAVSTAVPATVTPAAAPESIDLKIAALKVAIEVAEQEKAALLKASEEAFTAKLAEIPGLLGVASLKEALAILTTKVMGSITGFGTNGSPRTPGKGHRLSTIIVKQMRAMLGDRETAPYIAKTLGVGVSTVELYRSRWGMTRRQGIPQLKVHRPSTNRLAPEQRNQLVAALTSNRSSVTRLAHRFGVSRQAVYNVRHSLLKHGERAAA